MGDLSRLFYDENGQVDPADVTLVELPMEIRRVVQRAARLDRYLTDLTEQAPEVILREERRMLAESLIALNEWMGEQLLTPARRLCDEKTNAETRSRLIKHLKAGHDHVFAVHPSATLQVLHELHDQMHENECGHEEWSLDV